MRLDLLTIEPSRRVLEAVEQMSGWGSTLTNGHALGVASFQSSGAATALVLEIAQTSSGIRLVKASVAIDVGVALDPRNLEGQVQSSLVFGLTAAISGEITLSDGVVDQANFHDYRIMRINEMPSIDIYIHESGERIYGAGECATALAAPALGNALFALTGKRIRELPFDKYFRFS
jgi:isoquinoline 1-oxidoreductase beta subunit